MPVRVEMSRKQHDQTGAPKGEAESHLWQDGPTLGELQRSRNDGENGVFCGARSVALRGGRPGARGPSTVHLLLSLALEEEEGE